MSSGEGTGLKIAPPHTFIEKNTCSNYHNTSYPPQKISKNIKIVLLGLGEGEHFAAEKLALFLEKIKPWTNSKLRKEMCI